MRATFQIRGVVPIIPTPFTSGEQIDWAALKRLVDFAVEAGACAIGLPAYASEFYKLSEDERFRLVEQAVGHAGGRVPVIAQVNYPAAVQAVEWAVRGQQSGASAICATVPRLFALGEADLFRYFDRILKAIEIPLIIQDFNPGGPSISVRFIAELHRVHPHFRYVKLEEPMMAAKTRAILQETNGEVGVLEGWGGMYMLELVSAGVAAVVPGLALTDLLVHIFRLLETGRKEEAFEIFQGVLPQIVYSLQNLELFHHAEKRLLKARGLLEDATVREASLELSPQDAAHIDFLNARVLALL